MLDNWKDLIRPKLGVAELGDRYGRFELEPLERGFGTTLGNSLRRILLSSLKGSAVGAVKIDGVLHEFSSVPGVVEDTTDIILNLKQIPFKSHSDHPETLTLTAERPETLDLMRRHIDQLAQDFRDLGYRNLAFSFASEGGQRGTGGQMPQPDGTPPDLPRVDAPPSDTAPPSRTGPMRLAGEDRLDLRL